MGKRIILVSVGVLGFVLTLIQMHSISFYADHLLALVGSKTEAEEVTLDRERESVGAYTSPDVALEQIVVYKKKHFASATEEAAKEVRVWATAYTSHPLETDSSPFITASGSFVRDGIAAANFLPMGTKFKLPDLYGDKIFVVEDRMNSRYNETKIIDLWFTSRSEALQFGRRSVTIELL